MILKRLHIQNFLSIKSVKLELDNRGMVLICGENKDNPDFQSNGAGKSSIMEALTYVLFGKTVRGLKSDEVVNKISKRNCKVMLDLVDDDGTSYRIARYRKHQQQSNKFFMFCNSKDITPKSEVDFTKAITDLLQMDFMTFTSSILYSANSFKFTSATDSELKSAFDTMLGLNLYASCQEECKRQLREAERELERNTSNIQLLKNELSELEDSLNQANQDSEEFIKNQDAKLEEYTYQIECLVEDKESLETKLSHQNTILEKAEKELSSAKQSKVKLDKTLETLSELENEISLCKNSVVSYDKAIAKQNARIDSSKTKVREYEGMIRKISDKIDKVKVSISESQDKIGTPCLSCGAKLTAKSIQSVVNDYCARIAEFEDEISEYQEEIKEQNDFQSRISGEIDKLTKEQSQSQSDLEGLESLYHKSSKLKDKRDAMFVSIGKAELKVSQECSNLDKIKTEIKNTKHQLSEKVRVKSEIEERENPHLGYVDKFTSQMDSNNQELEKLLNSIQPIQEQVECLQFWSQAYGNGGIKSLLLDDITPYLNRQSNKFLHKLSSDHMEIKFSTQAELKSGEKREKFNIEVTNADGGDSYASNSSGEKKRVDLAINLALQSLVSSRSNKKLNLIMLDEVLDSLDDAGVSNVMELLSELAKDKSSIFVISHNDSIKSVFTETITIVKQGGYSVIGDSSECDEEEGE